MNICSILRSQENCEHQLDDSRTMRLDSLISLSETSLIEGLPSSLSTLSLVTGNLSTFKVSVAESDSPILRLCTNSHKMHNFRNSVLSYILNPTGSRRTTTPHLECCCLQKVGLFAYKLGTSLLYSICICLAHLLRFRLLCSDNILLSAQTWSVTRILQRTLKASAVHSLFSLFTKVGEKVKHMAEVSFILQALRAMRTCHNLSMNAILLSTLGADTKGPYSLTGRRKAYFQ
jgi:hypothetical protein